jgi:Rap1a immunity proteins
MLSVSRIGRSTRRLPLTVPVGSLLPRANTFVEDVMKLRSVLFYLTPCVLAASISHTAAQTKGSTDSPLLVFNGVVRLCERQDATSIAACGAYITGFVQGSHASQKAAVIETVAREVARGGVPPTNDAIDAAAARRHEDLSLFCIRSSWTAGYVQAHVVQHAREHPDMLNEASEDQMLKVLAKAFPCSERK